MGGKLLFTVERRVPAAALAVIGAATLSAAATGAAPTTKFSSKQYGYTVTLPGSPSGWSSSYAFVVWATDTVEPGSPAFDTFLENSTGRRFVVAARRPPGGATLAKWTTFVATTLCTKPKSFTNSTLSGAPARVFTWKCSDGNAIGVTALHGSRGYFMWVLSPPGLSAASNANEFNTARQSFRFVNR
jgi:hypothetical protein